MFCTGSGLSLKLPKLRLLVCCQGKVRSRQTSEEEKVRFHQTKFYILSAWNMKVKLLTMTRPSMAKLGITYTTKILVKWCIGSIKTSVKSSRPILTSFTLAWYCKIPEFVTWSADWADVLEIVSSELTSTSRGYWHVNCSWGLLFNDISSKTTISVSRFRRDWVVFR